MRLGTERIGPDEVAIEVNVDGSGQFSAEFDDAEYSAPTRKELLEKLERAVKAARETRAVDVTVLGLVATTKGRDFDDGPYTAGICVVDAKLRGKHQREYNAWLMVSADGKKFKYSSSRRESIQLARRLTRAEVEEYIRLREVVQEAEAALAAFVETVQIDPEETVAEACKPAKAVR